MKTHIWKTEMTRLFRGTGMKLAVLLAFAIAVWEFIAVSLPMSPFNKAYVISADSSMPYHLWTNWLGGEMLSFPSYLYRLLLPILAALPFAATYASDMSSGYAGQLVSRVKKRSYLKAKIFTVWFGGGLASVLPLVFSFLLASAVLPLRGPNRRLNGVGYIHSDHIFGALFGEKPFAYLALWSAVIFAFCGAMALVALFISLYVKNTFLIWITPFTVYLCTNEFARRMGIENVDMVLPMQFLHPMQCASPATPSSVVFGEMAALMLFGWLFYILAARRDTL